MRSELEALPIGEVLALDQQLLRRELLLDEHRSTFGDQAEARETVMGAFPARDELLDEGDLFGDVAGMARIAG